MKKRISKLVIIVLMMFLSVLLISCGEEKEKVIAADARYEIHTEAQKNYLLGNYNEVTLYAKGDEELSKPNGVTITWDLDDSLSYLFYLSENNEFKDAKTYPTNTNKIELINLKINTLYYWYVEYENTKTDTKTFVIDGQTPRNLDVDGVTNVRDLGGYKIGVNKYVKQGMIYRSARFNENETTDLLITETGIKEMVEVLKIKSELDIRRVDNNENGGLVESPLGKGVNYYSVPMKSGGNILLLNKDIIKDIFMILGDEANYPLVIHCSIGTDRTGLVCFLINALMGVSEEDLYRDFLFSNFANIGGSRTSSIIEKYLLAIDSAEGDTLATKTYNYLLGIGVSEDDLKTVIRVMTEKR